jgi:hypothetical protein
VVYKNHSADLQIRQEHEKGYIVESIEINNGIFAHIQGMQYPEKGIVPTEDLWHWNAVKRLLIESMRLFKYFVPLLVFNSVRNKVADWFIVIAYKMCSPYILLPEHLTPMAQELMCVSNDFFREMGIKEYEQLSEILVNVINQDNAYRYRLQDLFNETDKFTLYNSPRKEIKRLMLINRSRESQHKNSVSNKFKLFANVISLLLLHPKIKRAFRWSIAHSDFDKLKPDTADWFWMNLRGGYKYFGKDDKERRMDVNHLRVSKPTRL